MKPGLTALLALASCLLLPLGAMAAAKETVPTVKTPVSAAKAPVAADTAPAAAKGGFADKNANSAEKGRSLAFNKQNIYMYFRQVDEAKNKLPEDMPYQELRDRQCHLYASVLKQSGHDFEATVLNAIEFSEKGGNRLDDPRFMFLAG
ncbi:MAG: hypothetical protein ACLGQH_06645, partial [Acidobacteriota bacterium]